METQWIKGTELREVDKRHVLTAYIHRFTGNHVPKWVKDSGRIYPVHFLDDLDWLEHTRFAVRKNGDLDMRFKRCESSPTWPK